MKIFIDVGHGGKDTGAVYGNIIERNINLIVAIYLYNFLLKFEEVEVLLSRNNNDIYLSLEERAKMANKWGADLLISIHHNAGGGVGYDVIHSVFTGEDFFGEELAHKIGEEFTKLGQEKHGIYSRWNEKYNDNYYGIIRMSEMDAIISEFAFIDSVDRFDIDTDEELKNEAKAIANAIVYFFELEEKDMKKTADQLIDECLVDKEYWKKYCDYAEYIGLYKGNTGVQSKGEYIRVLIEKIYEYGYEQGKLNK